MSDEPEARMWDDGARYEARGAYFESAFASSEHLDRAPLLADDTYTEVSVGAVTDPELAEHCHWKLRNEPPSAIPQLLTALVLCGLFMLCELLGGYMAGSISVMSDAAHMLSDCGGFALALLAFYCARRQPDADMSYGYKRAEVLGAMVSVLLIWVLTGIFVYVAATRLYSGEYSVQPDLMLLVSGAGVGFNVVLALVLHGCDSRIAHHHSHGGLACNSHSGPPSVPRRFTLWRRVSQHKHDSSLDTDYSLKDTAPHTHTHTHQPAHTRNINLRAALIHVIGDLIQSCGVLLASIIIKFYPSAQFIDPVCTFLFSVIVLLTTTRVVRDALSMLMQAVPKQFRYREFVSALASIPGVRHVHSVHAWALSTHHVELTAHVAIDELTDPESVLASCQRAARQYGAAAATFQVERHSYQPACLACRQPPTLP